MTATLKMLAPPGGAPSIVQCSSGAAYVPDANGIIAVAATGQSGASDDVVALIRAGWTVLGVSQARNNFTATSDPAAANDNTQDYAAGSFWFNTATSRAWLCLSAATGAAVWALDGVVPGTGAEPSNMLTLFGGLALGGANFPTFKEEGNLYRAIANPIAGNNADATDDILAGIALDAGAFDQAGRGLCITAQGKTGATTNNKRFKLFLNPTMSGQTVTAGVIAGGTVTAGTPVVDSGAWVNGTTPNNAVGWSAQANLFKYGAAGSNTQYAQGSPILGGTHGGISAPTQLTLTESAAITIVVTGSSYTTSAANDVVLDFFEVNAMN